MTPVRYVYLAGPMSKGSLMDHVRVALETADTILTHGGIPFLPQLSILQHLHRPRDYESWMTLDFAIIERFDALLRLPGESSGGDREIEYARNRGKAVFYSLETYLVALDLELRGGSENPTAVLDEVRVARRAHDMHMTPDPTCAFCRGDIT